MIWLAKESITLNQWFWKCSLKTLVWEPFKESVKSKLFLWYYCVYVCMHIPTHVCAQLCSTFCIPMDCSLPHSSVHGIFQARVLEWVTISYSRDLPVPGIKPMFFASPELQVYSLSLSHLGSLWYYSDVTYFLTVLVFCTDCTQTMIDKLLMI